MKPSQRPLSLLLSFLLFLACATWIGDVPVAEAQQDIQVNSADPPSTPQGTISLSVSIKGKGFKRGAQAKWFVTGTTNPGGVTVNSTTFVGGGELVANITVADDAVIADFDIQVQNSDGRTGKGIELFSVTEKSPPPGQAPPPDPAITYTYGTTGHLYVMNDDGTNRTIIFRPKRTQQGARQPSWSPDGSQIVFASDYKGIGLYIINTDGTGLCKLLALNDQQSWGSTRPVWSPLPLADGKYRIAYGDKPNPLTGEVHLFVVNADCQNPGTPVDLTLTTTDIMGRKPSWSPLADKIAVDVPLSPPRILVYGIAVIDGKVTVTSRTDLTGTLGMNMQIPTWSKTGGRIAVYGRPWPTDGSLADLWIVDEVNPGNIYNLSNSPAWQDGLYESWSPDDTEIVFQYNVVEGGYSYVVKINVATGAVTHFERNQGMIHPDWRRCFRVCPVDKPGCQLCK